MNREPELSIIVPVFNVEDYLDGCVQSILNQTYQDYEIILIDDGSTDNSGQMCDSFTDERIRVFHKENGGLSSARNVGLEQAKGQFITFVDSDDQYGDKETLSENMQIMRNSPEIDFLQFPYTIIRNGEITLTHVPKERLLYDSDIFKEWYRHYDILNYNVWNKIYKKDSIHGLRFLDSKTAEDAYSHLDFIPQAHCVYVSEHGNYQYLVREGSIANSDNGSRSWIKFQLDSFDIRTLIYQEATKRQELKVHRLKYYFELVFQFYKTRIELPNYDYGHIRKRLFSNKLTINVILGYSNSPEATKRDIRHAWAFYFLGSWYDPFIWSYLRTKNVIRSYIPHHTSHYEEATP